MGHHLGVHLLTVMFDMYLTNWWGAQLLCG